MRICINSRDLNSYQRARIEEYFSDNFSFEEKHPTLVWKDDESDGVFLGYPYGKESAESPAIEDFESIMVRIHEGELLTIVGRGLCATTMN